MILFTCETTKAAPVFRIATKLVHILQYVIPMILIIMITFDFVKLIVNGNIDDKAKKDTTTKVVKRLFYAIIIFLVPSVVNLFLTNVIDTSGNSGNWLSCWTYYYNSTK